MFQVGKQVAVPGKATMDFLCRCGLHLDHGFVGLVHIKITNSHLVSAHDKRDFVFGHHHRDILHSGRTLGQPARGIVHSQLRVHPSICPFRAYQVPQLVEVPETVPECIATQGRGRRIAHSLQLFFRIDPFSIHITEGIAAAECPVHIGVKPYFFKPVIGGDFYPV